MSIKISVFYALPAGIMKHLTSKIDLNLIPTINWRLKLIEAVTKTKKLHIVGRIFRIKSHKKVLLLTVVLIIEYLCCATLKKINTTGI